MRPTEAAARAKKVTSVPWDDLRAARVQRRVLEGMRSTERVRPRLPARWISLAAAALIIAGALGAAFLWVQSLRAPAASGDDIAGVIELPDGSRVVLQQATDSRAAGRVVPLHISRDRVEMDHLEGTASYDVAKSPERVFVVRAGDVRVEVLGTSFRIEKLEKSVRVVVREGRVKVTRSDQSVVLVGGDDITFGEGDGSLPAASSPAAPTSTLPSFSAEPPSSATPSVPTPSASAPQQTAAQLFRQADDARGRGDNAEALLLLRRLVADFPRDSRVTLAMFTIGRLELQRGEPTLAAKAFEACGGAMQGEATAEAALAWSRAGSASRATTLANRYLTAHPDGPRRAEMEKLAK